METTFTTTFGNMESNAPEKEKRQAEKVKGRWQQVTIGGVTGIAMGAAAMYGMDTMAQAGNEAVAENDGAAAAADGSTSMAGDVRVAEVSQDLSFGEAFAAARQDVGAGGVFQWHGNVYNTYTEAEWNSMSAEEHAQFAQQVQPQVQVENSHYQASHGGQSAATHQDEDAATSGQPHVAATTQEGGDEPEVHFLGMRQVETDDGGTMNVGHMVIGNQDVALVDLDNDEVFDVAISDLNHNNEIDENEFVDISDRHMTVTDFAIASTQESDAVGPEEPVLASSPQDDLAGDMPDYMNDVDVQSI